MDRVLSVLEAVKRVVERVDSMWRVAERVEVKDVRDMSHIICVTLFCC